MAGLAIDEKPSSLLTAAAILQLENDASRDRVYSDEALITQDDELRTLREFFHDHVRTCETYQKVLLTILVKRNLTEEDRSEVCQVSFPRMNQKADL